MESSFWLGTTNLAWSIVYTEGSQVKFPNYILFLTLKIVLVLTNSVDPEKMPLEAAFIVGLYCLSKYAFKCHHCYIYVYIIKS